MNEPIHKNCIAERDWLRREYERLNAENAQLEAARKVASAAAHYWACDDGDADFDAQAFSALDDAVREYRKMTEASA